MIKYKLERFAPLRRIANKIMDEVEAPVAVIMLGYNGQRRQHILNELIDYFGRRYMIYDCSATQCFDQLCPLKGHWKVHILDLKDALGGFASVRQSAVKALRCAGAKTIVGFYVDESRPDLSGGRYQDPPNGWYPDIPCAEEFDYFVVAHDDSLLSDQSPIMTESADQAPG